MFGWHLWPDSTLEAFPGAIDPSFALAGLQSLLLTSLGLTGNLIRLERRLLFVELIALRVILVFNEWIMLAVRVEH